MPWQASFSGLNEAWCAQEDSNPQPFYLGRGAFPPPDARPSRCSGLTALPPSAAWGNSFPHTPLGWGAGNRVDAVVQKHLVRGVVRPGGLEPPAFWSVARRSVQLSYGRTKPVPAGQASMIGSANGNRTRVSTLRGWCPQPLDDGAPIAETTVAGEQGFEPRYCGPEPHVLPLDDSPAQPN